MLKNFLVKFSFFKFIQTGLLLDFFFKKLAEIFMKNIFIYSFLFFGEKYIIEYLTKKTIDSYIYNNNKFNNNFNHHMFFIQIILLCIYCIFIFYFFIFFL